MGRRSFGRASQPVAAAPAWGTHGLAVGSEGPAVELERVMAAPQQFPLALRRGLAAAHEAPGATDLLGLAEDGVNDVLSLLIDRSAGSPFS